MRVRMFVCDTCGCECVIGCVVVVGVVKGVEVGVVGAYKSYQRLLTIRTSPHNPNTGALRAFVSLSQDVRVTLTTKATTEEQLDLVKLTGR